MNKQRTLCFIGAHPDDETFGIGGTLAQYAAAGVNVYYICATRGEAGLTNPKQLREHSLLGDLRWEELNCAAKILGLADIIYLGYRDSGMPDSEDNKHPEALAMASLDEVSRRILTVVRNLKPDVIITFDPIGGYRHPDHIAIHNATVKAFEISNDQTQYPEAGTAFHPQKLYFSIFSRRLLKVAVMLLPLFGQDPHRFGLNNDVDITKLAEVEFPIHTVIHLTKEAISIRDKAAACYVSQMGSGPPRKGLLSLIGKIFGRRDLFMRAYPPTDNRKETDLFEGVL